ncbi:MAG: hypothetical protein Q7S74_04800 [Nanoarchaeota archaeon]|nr:hypothetical protein [Nanoarchaeota archaeon]
MRRIKRGKASDVVMDIPLLHKKGLIKLPDPPKLPKNVRLTEGFIDFSADIESSSEDSQNPIQSSSSQLESSPTTSNPFDMLNSLASSNSSSQSIPAIPDFDSSSPYNSHPHQDLAHLKVKLEDLEYKLERFLERLEAIESKLV